MYTDSGVCAKGNDARQSGKAALPRVLPRARYGPKNSRDYCEVAATSYHLLVSRLDNQHPTVITSNK